MAGRKQSLWHNEFIESYKCVKVYKENVQLLLHHHLDEDRWYLLQDDGSQEIFKWIKVFHELLKFLLKLWHHFRRQHWRTISVRIVRQRYVWSQIASDSILCKSIKVKAVLQFPWFIVMRRENRSSLDFLKMGIWNVCIIFKFRYSII